MLALVQAAPNANTFAIHGRSVEKEMAELLPSILRQLGPDSMAALKQLAESFKQAQGGEAAGADDDEIPDLVESFDKVDVEEKKEENKEEKKEGRSLCLKFLNKNKKVYINKRFSLSIKLKLLLF